MCRWTEEVGPTVGLSKREEYWIRQLGTAAPYGCNDHIDCIGNLTSPGCQSVNVLNLFDRTNRIPRSHGSRRYNKPEIHDVSFDFGFTVRSSSYSYKTVLSSIEIATWIVWIYIDQNRRFKTVRVGETTETRNRPFLKVKFTNKGIDTSNLSNMLNQKSVLSKIPPYFQYKESPCISYSYTRSVASKIFNYKASLLQINFDGLSKNPTLCSCCDSGFPYAPCGHIVTGDLSIVRNQKLRDVLSKGPTYREPVSP